MNREKGGRSPQLGPKVHANLDTDMLDDALPDTQPNLDSNENYQVEDSCPTVAWSPARYQGSGSSNHAVVAAHEALPAARQERLPLNETTDNSLGKTKMSAGSSKGGSVKTQSTQEFSQGHFERVTSPDASKVQVADPGSGNDQMAAENTARTYATGQTGHVNLQGTKTPKSSEKEGFDQAEEDKDGSSEDDIDLFQTNLAASQFPEENRFQAPKTPATRGKKRTRDGQVMPTSDPGSGRASTPRPPVNPFARTGPSNTGVMSLTQVFKATQAPSSPMLNVPTSDGLSDRPSPNMWNMQRPEFGPESSPAKLSRPPISRSRTEPHGSYVPMLTSQEERERRRSPPGPASDSNLDTDSLFDNIAGPGSIGTRRYYPNDRGGFRATSRRIMGQISAVVDNKSSSGEQVRPNESDGIRYSNSDEEKDQNVVNIVSGSESIKSSPVQMRQNLFQSPAGLQNQDGTARLSEEDVQNGQEIFVEGLDLDGEETEREMSDGVSPGLSQNNDNEENNKENRERSPIQVPRTVARKTRHILIQDVQKEDAGGLSPYRTESQLVAVANSQPAAASSQDDRAKPSPISITNSQPRVPDSTQVAPDTSKGTRNAEKLITTGSSLPVGSAPLSSPSPQKGTPPEYPPKFVRKKSRFSTQTGSREGLLLAASEDVITSPERPRTLSDDKEFEEKISKKGTTAGGLGEPYGYVVLSGSVDLPETVPETGHGDQRAEEAGHRVLPIDPVESTNPESPQKPPSQRKLRRPRKFAEVVQQQSSQSQGLDFDINALTHDDNEFKRVIGASPDSSPVRPARKRLRQRESPDYRTLLHGVQPSSETESSTNFQTATSRNVPSHNPGHKSTASSDHVSNQSEREHNYIAKNKRPIVDSTPDMDPGNPPAEENPKDTRISAEAGSRLKRSKRGKSELSSRPISQDEQSSFDKSESAEWRRMAHSATAPNRVWAYFNGSPSGYYPATCLGVSEAHRLRVRFDDNKEDTVPAANVRRLELRLGDIIKVDGGPGNRNHNTCVVQELMDRGQDLPQPSEELVSTDVHGWSSLKLAVKKKDGQLEPLDQPVPVSSIYLTKALFHGLRGRDYFPTTLVNDELGALSPSVYNSLPDTPASRKRRSRVPNKKESSVLQSFKSSGVRNGLFSGMAFVVTSVDKSKRSELTSLIENNGGRLLTKGLDSLFDVPDEHLSQSSEEASVNSFGLSTESSFSGFTALLAEKYSRTTNYLYALSLNVPCISICWMRDCVAQKRLVDWRHYLLPSGESLFLDGTVISRSMNIPSEFVLQKPSTQWPLKSMFESRTRPMAGQNVLILSNASTQKTMGGHLFISYAMGADRVCMAQGWKEANDYLQDGKTRWDWICAPGELNQGGKGRKRKSNPAESSDDLEVGFKDGVKVVKPEFIVQSLVFGRLLVE